MEFRNVLRDGIALNLAWKILGIVVPVQVIFYLFLKRLILESLVELKLTAELCPEMPILFGNEIRSIQIKCKDSQDCVIDESCCFNGVGMSCLSRSNKKHFKIEHIPLLAVNDGIISGECAAKSKLHINPGCRSNCKTDLDCQNLSAFLRCCPFGCGKRCQFVTNQALLPCIYLQAAHWNEADKMGFGNSVIFGRPSVQCTQNGDFERIQCDVSIGFLLKLKVKLNF